MMCPPGGALNMNVPFHAISGDNECSKKQSWTLISQERMLDCCLYPGGLVVASPVGPLKAPAPDSQWFKLPKWTD